MLFRFLFLLIPIVSFSDHILAAKPESPNIVVIFCDDLGYGDLSCFGHPTIKTPNLDRMAAEGVRLTQFYSASPVCTPSRAALMTGRLPIRSGMCSDKRRVLFPDSGGGIPASEVTLAEGLKKQGYATACVGKWHLGHLPQFLPTNNGFDSYFGIPYSNDMDRVNDAPRGRDSFWDPKVEYWNVPLMRDLEIQERPADQTTITRRYAEEAVSFIRKNKDEKFFLYLPHSLPHVPLFRSKEFEGKSLRGLYGDVIEEIDWSVGQVLQTLRDLKLDQKTIVWFTSDNGPWLTFNDHGGSAGLLREGKGTTWDGGMREPSICWWPGTIPAGQVSAELGTTMDIYSTSLALAGAELEKDRIVDGYDLTESLKGNAKSPRDIVYYYRGTRLMALRKGPWKAHFATQESYTGNNKLNEHDPPVLYNLELDPSEKWDVAARHPEVIAEIKAAADAHQKTVVAVPSQLEIPLPR
ncbi:MAG: sulfatase [Planctomycetota bacterium]|nr:sulfatase [Planctomycetota bacterium]MDA0919420.1 sulfatase [Planctomycetota bacterium]MDA1160308.1 sulfatase [Planctomycetota bacterium]